MSLLVRFYRTEQTANAPTWGLFLISRNSNQSIFTEERKDDLLRTHHCLEEGVEREDSHFNSGHKEDILSACVNLWRYSSHKEKNKFTKPTTTILKKYVRGHLA